MTALPVTAQEITKQGLLGKWAITKLRVKGHIIDFQNNTVAFSEDFQSRLSKEELVEAEKKLISDCQQFVSNTVEFLPNNQLKFFLYGKTTLSAYSLKEENGKQLLGNGAGRFTGIWMEGAELALEAPKGGLVMIFKKVK